MDDRFTTTGPARRRDGQPVVAGEDRDLPMGPFVVPMDPKSRAVRVRDVLVASLGLVLVAPLLLLLALSVVLDTRGPALFSHRRLGRFGRPFTCYKFRTMVVGADDMLDDLLASDRLLARQYATRFKLERDPRVTRTGRWLRRLSLDELPQLLNVVRGDMSLVGPRPIVAAECPRYGASLPEVLSTRPGMTGLWQVSGRSRTSYATRVELDVHYVRTRSFTSDLGIIMKTIVQVFRRENGAT